MSASCDSVKRSALLEGAALALCRQYFWRALSTVKVARVIGSPKMALRVFIAHISRAITHDLQITSLLLACCP